MENPFIVTGKIKPEYFCDRQSEAQRIISKVTSGENIVLMAERRIGKSKLIEYCMAQPTIADNYLTLSIDILRTSSINELAYELGKAVFEHAMQQGDKMRKMVVNTLKSINACFGYDPINNTPTFSLSLGDISSPLYTLDEIFTCLEKADRRCIVAIDEFQQIGSYPEKNTEAVLRTYIQQCGNANFIFSGSERHMIEEMFREKAHPFYNSADIMSLDVIPLDKYIEFATRLFEEFGRGITEGAVELAYKLFEGNTYYIQKTMHELFNTTAEGCEADKQGVEQIVENIVLDNNRRFSETLSHLTLPQKELLYAISKEGKAQRLTSALFIKKHNLRSASSVQTSLKKLMEYHLVSTSNSVYYVNDQLMQLWLQRVNG